jgi:hypothetical protein
MSNNGGDTPLAPDAGYVLILICRPVDQFRHNDVFAQELAAGFATFGIASRICDFRSEVRMAWEALLDPRCLFLVSFNGFGSELCFSLGARGDVTAAYEHSGKPLFDLMHDCPSHDTMTHQIASRSTMRRLLLTDHGYLQEAQELGIPSTRFVPSITFPASLPDAPKRIAERPIDILLPMQVVAESFAATFFYGRHDVASKLDRAIFEHVTARCEADLSLDARVELRAACRAAGLAFDVNRPESRTLLTITLDHVKSQRRRSLVQALRHLPVTLLSTVPPFAPEPGDRLKLAAARDFTDLLRVMGDSRIVLCPLPHMTGWHERALGAFSAGAAVVAAPNEPLEVNFRHGEHLMFYRSAEQAADLLAELLAEPDRIQALASAGHAEAMERFSPTRLASMIVAMWRRDHAPRAPRQDAPATAATQDS